MPLDFPQINKLSSSNDGNQIQGDTIV